MSRIETRGPDRLPPIADAGLTPAQQRAAVGIRSGPRGNLRGPFVPLLRSPELMDRIQALGAHIRFGTKLTAPARELAILLTARWANCEYEFQAHRKVGLEAGLASAKIDAVGLGRTPEGLTAEETLVHDVVTELLSAGALSDATWARGIEGLGEAGLVDLLALPGYYFMLALVLNSARTPQTGGDPGPFATDQAWPSKLPPR